MRKLLSVLLTLTISMTAFAGFGTTVNAVSYSKYKSKVKAGMKYDGNGFLCDFDNKGTKELVMWYIRPNYYNCETVLKVYTIKKGKVVTVLSKVIKGDEMDGGTKSELIGVFKKSGKKILCLKLR